MAMYPPQLSSTGVEAAVDTLQQSVATILQEINGGCEFSVDVVKTLSKCKADLDTAVERASGTSNADSEEGFGLYEAKPMKWKVSNKLLLETRIGNFLQRRHCLEKATLAIVAITTLSYFASKSARFGTKVYSDFTNETGDTVTAEFVRPHPGVYSAFVVLFTISCFLTTHGLNRRLTWAVTINFEGMALAGSQIGAAMIQAYNFHQTLGSDFDVVWRIIVCMHYLLRIWLAMIITGIDGLKFSRKIRIAGQVCVACAYGFQVVQMRCASKEYPEEFMVCSPTLMTFREMGSALLLQAVIFLAKNVAGKMEGSTFGNIHPVWVSAEDSGKDVMTVSRTISDLGKKITKRMSTKTSISSQASVERRDSVEAKAPSVDESKASTDTPSDRPSSDSDGTPETDGPANGDTPQTEV